MVGNLNNIHWHIIDGNIDNCCVVIKITRVVPNLKIWLIIIWLTNRWNINDIMGIWFIIIQWSVHNATTVSPYNIYELMDS